MAEGEARVRLRVVGRRAVEREVQQTARGVTRETRKAAQEQRRAEKQAEQERRRAAQRAAREDQQNARAKARNEALVQREIVRLVRDAERAKRRENDRTTREATRNARSRARAEAQALRERARAEQRAAREAERGRERAARGRAGALAAVGAVGVGLGAAGLSGARRAQGVIGIPTQDEALRQYQGFRRQLIQTGSEAGLSDDQINRAQARILESARASTTDPMDLLSGLSTAQARFDKFDDFLDAMPAMANVRRASGADFQDIVAAGGEAQRAWQLAGGELEEFLNIAFVGSRRGSIEFGSVATDFSNAFGSAAAAQGQGGMAGAREALALSQVLGTSGSAPSEVATMFERTLETLLDSDVQRRFRGAGIELAQENGRLRPLQEIAQELASNESLNDPRKLQELVGGRIEARRGVRVLRQRAIDSPEMFGSLENISAAEGAAGVAETVDRMADDPVGRAEAMAIERLVDTFEDGGRLTEAMMAAAGPLTELENEFPLLTAAISELTPVVYALGTIMAARALGLGGGGGVVGGGGGGIVRKAAGAAGTLGGTAGAGTALAGSSAAAGLAVVGGVAAVAGVGYHIISESQRMGEELEARERQLAEVEARLGNATTPEDLQRGFDEARGLEFGGTTAPSAVDLSNIPFFRDRTPTVELSENSIRLLRQQGIGATSDDRRRPGGSARRTD